MKYAVPQWHLLNQQGPQAHNAAHTLRPQPTLHRVSKPRYLVCKTSLPFLQCKLNMVHNYSARLLTPRDAASDLAESCLPRDNLRGSGTPQSLALGVPRAGGEKFGLTRSGHFGGSYIPRTEIVPGKNKTREAQCCPPHDAGWEILTWPMRPSLTMYPCVPGSDYPHLRLGRLGMLLSHETDIIHILLPETSP